MAATFVQGRVVGQAGDPAALAYTSDVVAGNLLVAVFGFNDNTTSVSTLTDDQGNTWTRRFNPTVTSYNFEVWTTPAGASGPCTVTADFNAASTSNAPYALAEISGMGAWTVGESNTLDVLGGSAANPLPLATLTTSAAGIIFTVARVDTAFNFSSWNDSFISIGTGTTGRGLVGYRITATGVSAAPTAAMAANESGESLTCVLYEGSGGGGARPSNLMLLGVR